MKKSIIITVLSLTFLANISAQNNDEPAPPSVMRNLSAEKQEAERAEKIRAEEAKAEQIIAPETRDLNEPAGIIYDFVEQVPRFPGGEVEMEKFITNHFVYPAKIAQIAIKGNIYVKFLIEKDGSLHDVKVIKGFSTELDAEAIRVVKAMPNWSPGGNEGKAVRSNKIIVVKIK